jgi:hypothetical protein
MGVLIRGETGLEHLCRRIESYETGAVAAEKLA